MCRSSSLPAWCSWSSSCQEEGGTPDRHSDTTPTVLLLSDIIQHVVLGGMQCHRGDLPKAVAAYRRGLDILQEVSLRWEHELLQRGETDAQNTLIGMEEEDVDESMIMMHEEEANQGRRTQISPSMSSQHGVFSDQPVVNENSHQAAILLYKLLMDQTQVVPINVCSNLAKDHRNLLHNPCILFSCVMTLLQGTKVKLVGQESNVHESSSTANRSQEQAHHFKLVTLLQQLSGHDEEAQACLEYLGSLLFYNLAICLHVEAVMAPPSLDDEAQSLLWEEVKDYYHMAMGTLDKNVLHAAPTWVELACLNNQGWIQTETLHRSAQEGKLHCSVVPQGVMQLNGFELAELQCCGTTMKILLHSLQVSGLLQKEQLPLSPFFPSANMTRMLVFYGQTPKALVWMFSLFSRNAELLIEQGNSTMATSIEAKAALCGKYNEN